MLYCLCVFVWFQSYWEYVVPMSNLVEFIKELQVIDSPCSHAEMDGLDCVYPL